LSNKERDLLELPRLVKKVMENKCWKERERWNTHLEWWTCASGKWVVPRHEWSSRYQITHGWKRLSMDLSSKLSRISMKAKKRWGAFLFFSFLFFLFLLFFPSSFFFSYYFFLLLFFFIHFYFPFLFIIFMFLLTFKKHSTCYSSLPPCFNYCSSSCIEVRGHMAAIEVWNPPVPL
jgi:hypothetical protein